MKTRTIIVIAIIILAIVGGIVFRFTAPMFKEKGLQQSSQAQNIKATINVAGDNYLGYWFLNSQQFQYALHNKGYGIKWTNDNGDYADRNAKFKDGKYDIIVLPVNSYLLHGLNNNYPGVIVGCISDSKGADSIIAYKDKLQSTNGTTQVNDLNISSLKIGFTPDSPSSFLLETAIIHFDLNQLKDNTSWKVETSGGSNEAFNKFKNKQLDVAVLWEPDVSKSLNIPNTVQVFGSDQISGMIIDCFVVNRQYLSSHSDRVIDFFNAYFDTLYYYSSKQDEMRNEMVKSTGLNQQSIKTTLDRIMWFDKQTNADDWFAQNNQLVNRRAKILDTITQITDVMIENKDVKEDPLHNNPFTIIADNSILSKIYGDSNEVSLSIGASPISTIFPTLDNNAWNTLKVIGTLRVLPILFQSGTSQLTVDGKNTVDNIAGSLIQTYLRYRVLIKGHTAPSSNEEANTILSQERADSVKNYLISAYNIDINRIKSIGMGSKELLTRANGEGDLSYRARLARVEFTLLENK